VECQLDINGGFVNNLQRAVIAAADSSAVEAHVAVFFDQDSNTFSYVVRDPQSQACAVIDSVLNFDYPSATISHSIADAIIKYIQERNLQVEWHIETHVHADHLSAGPYLQKYLGGKLAIGEHIVTVQETFGKIFNEGTDFQRDASQFDHLFKDGETYAIGNLEATAIHTPGHTPACMVHVIGKSAFVGDTIFMPDSGTARADFPGGSAQVLYQSAQKILNLSPDTKLYLCHDYGAEGREVEYQTTVAEQQHNVHLGNNATEDQFVALREKRDSGLGIPRLMIPAIQVNMRAGHFPQAQDNGAVCLKLPINSL
jgi:glyoxylase-like metal-dependent hydrolase (beta-lactamase superfamily II)|tara:strand:+ start:186 stop:1124 length:939 start_codon:yes stop_codon:yes gene_type:complete